MGRQLFLHHYLPAHLASSLVAGALVEFVFNLEPSSPEPSSSSSSSSSTSTTTTNATTSAITSALDPSDPTTLTTEGAGKQGGKRKGLTDGPRRRPVRERLGTQSLLATWAASGVILAAVVYGFVFFAPLTYGSPALSVEEVVRRKWLGYDLHFAK